MIRFLPVLILTALCSLLPTQIAQTNSLPRQPVFEHSIVLNRDLLGAAMMWETEIERLLQGTAYLCVICHGYTDPFTGDWYARPEFAPPRSVRSIVREVRAGHPDVVIVLIICNPDGIDLDEPGVMYAHNNIWTLPDRFLHPRSQNFPDPVGSIFEFTRNK